MDTLDITERNLALADELLSNIKLSPNEWTKKGIRTNLDGITRTAKGM